MPGEAVPVLHILSSRQGFALSPSVALTAGSVLLPVEYKQTSLLQSMTGIHSRLGFFFLLFFFPCAGCFRGLWRSFESGESVT